MMSLKRIYFSFSLFLIMCLLEVKSDTSHLETVLKTSEERATRENNRISELNQAFEEGIVNIRHAQEQLSSISVSMEQNLKDQVRKSQFERWVNEARSHINQLRARGSLTELERIENRGSLIQRLQQFVNYLNSNLSPYEQEKHVREFRIRELTNLSKIEETLNVNMHIDLNKRLEEQRATMPQAMRDSLAKDLSLKDELKRKIEENIKNLCIRHARDQPVDAEHEKEVQLLDNHWKQFCSIETQIVKQRKQLKILEEEQTRVAKEEVSQQMHRKRAQEENAQEQPAAKRYQQGPAGEGPSVYTGPKQGPGQMRLQKH